MSEMLLSWGIKLYLLRKEAVVRNQILSSFFKYCTDSFEELSQV